jgi:hypothetical protein
MGDLKHPDRILFLVTEETPGQVTINVGPGCDRSDPGTETTSNSNYVCMFDAKGQYIPCSAGGYHVHRGPHAIQEKKRCDCPHNTLQWLAKNRCLMICVECNKTFAFQETPHDEEYADAICALENDGVVSVFTQQGPATSTIQ